MATNEHSGYPLKWFKDQNAARHAYECAICLDVLEDAVQVRDCGHQFCALCIDDILKSDARCPSCRIELSASMIFEDHAARRLIKQLEVNCCQDGCNWTGCLSSLLQEHQNNCIYKTLSGSGKQLDVTKLEQQIQILTLRISTLENKHDEDVKALQHEISLLQGVGTKHVPQPKPEPTPTPGQQPSSTPTYHTWKIDNFTSRLDRAISENEVSYIDSAPFFSNHGYKMKLAVNLNEGPRGSNRSGYMGVYVALLKSDQDASLAWPFTKRYTFVLTDQQDDPSQRLNIERTQLPDGQKSFQRPTSRSNESYGYYNFVQHSTLSTRQYIKDDVVYIKIIVHP